MFLFFIIFFIKFSTVNANGNTYKVLDLEISKTYDNDFNKEEVIDIAFKKAFVTFVDKTLLRKDAESLYRTKIATIKDLVLGYQIGKNNK